MHKLQVASAIRKDEIIRNGFFILEKIILNYIGFVSQAQNEVFVSEMGVVLHHVPQDGPRADGDHWLRHIFGVTAQPHSGTAAEQYDFHVPTLLESSRI